MGDGHAMSEGATTKAEARATADAEWLAYVEQHKKMVVTMQVLGPLLQETVNKFRELASRIEVLEQRPEIKYLGVWDEKKVYPIASMVTCGGSIWYAKAPSVSRRPGTDAKAWQLAVKSGRDGKDLR